MLHFKGLTLLPIFGSLFLLGEASGALIVLEDFETKSSGELNGQAGGAGLSGVWRSQVGITEVVTLPANFAVTLPTGEVISGGTKGLEVTGDDSQAIAADLVTPQEDDFYVSFLVQMQAGSIGVNDFATVWFGEGTHIGAPAVGLKTNLGPGDTDFMGRITGNQEGYAPEQLAIGETYYLVAKVSKTGTSANFNQVDFWVNPGSNDELNPEATSIGSIAFSDFETIGIRSVNLTGNDRVIFDGFTVATEWDDLFTPIPEPSSALLALLAGFGLLGQRRRK